MKKKPKDTLGIGSKCTNEEGDEPFFLGGKKAQETQKRRLMLQDRKFRKRKLKEIDPEEYEDEIWLAYVEPQYENEYSRMMAT